MLVIGRFGVPLFTYFPSFKAVIEPGKTFLCFTRCCSDTKPKVTDNHFTQFSGGTIHTIESGSRHKVRVGAALKRLQDRKLLLQVSHPHRKPGHWGHVLRNRISCQGEKQESAYEVLRETLEESGSLYLGIDPTGPRLHLGHLLSVSVALHCMAEGLNIIFLVGGGTALLGDPSGKTSDRPSLHCDEVERNALSISASLSSIIELFRKSSLHAHGNDCSSGLYRVVNNNSWLRRLSTAEYLEKVARFIRMNDMLDRSVVRTRLKNGGSVIFGEFAYQTFQAYDWATVHTDHGCSVQIGGNDQLGNMEDGYHYIWRSRTRGEPSLCAVTVPLLVTSLGEKLGKSTGNAVWLTTSEGEINGKRQKRELELTQFLNTLGLESLTQLALMGTPCVQSTLHSSEQGHTKELISDVINYVQLLTPSPPS